MPDDGSEVYEGLPADAPLRISRMAVFGLQRTKADFVRHLLQPVMGATTLADVHGRLAEVLAELESLDVFASVQAELDSGPAPGLAELNIYTKEKSRIRAKTGTMMGEDDVSVQTSVVVRNVFGAAETLEVVGGGGVKSRGTLQVSFVKPIITALGSPRGLLSASLSQVTLDHTHTSSSKTDIRAARVAYQRGGHRFAYELAWRTLGGLSPSASMAVREHAGHSLKSSLHYQFERNTEDSPLMPSRGTHLRLATELAGLGGDVNFLSSEVNARASRRLWGDISASLTASGGALLPLDAEPRPVRLEDRLHMGGPLSIRGSFSRGLGPTAQRMGTAPATPGLLRDAMLATVSPHSTTRDSLGGDTYVGVGAHVHVPFYVPSVLNTPALRLHLFATAGSLINRGELANVGRDLWQSRVASVGAGIAVAVWHQLRLEINYCVPVWGDVRSFQSYQVGLGISL